MKDRITDIPFARSKAETPGSETATQGESYLVWPVTELAHQVARQAMDRRARFELGAVASGADLVRIHGETLERYPYYRRLIRGALAFLEGIGRGVGREAADLGSGTGIGACVLSRHRAVQHVYALEISEEYVARMMPFVFSRFGAASEKITRVVGDFNQTRFENQSLDLVLEVDSFHHSERLESTLREVRRVLRDAGTFVGIDRAWPDHYTHEQLEAMLDRQLPDGLKDRYGIPRAQSFTRRQWGEHEWTLAEWFQAFERAGFEPAALIQAVARWGNVVLWRLPTFRLSVLWASLMYRRGQRRLWIYGYDTPRVVFVCLPRR